jgi:hypothetical protein
MTSTKRPKLATTEHDTNQISNTLETLAKQFKTNAELYEKQNGKPYPVQLKENSDYDYVNPQHYVQEDGRQTWEHMVDEFGLYETAVFCKLNAYKYADRIGKKPNEDVEREQAKIDWYLSKADELFDINERLNNDKDWGYLKTD